MRPLSVAGVKGLSRHTSTAALMWSGVVPQQPPSTWTPRSAMAPMWTANSAGPTSKTVQPSQVWGRPALGLTIRGTEAYSTSCFTMGTIWAGPRPQLTPRASTPRPSSRATVEAGVPPVSSLPFSPYTVVTTTGRSQFSLAASTAALAS